MYRIIDTHCHLDMEEFDKDRDEVINRSLEGGVEAIVIPSTKKSDYERERKISEAYPIIFYMVGVHPHDAKTADHESYELALEHLKNERCVGVGEIGLDYHYNHSPKDIQKEVFANFLDIAKEQDVPVSIHCREAEDDLIDILISKKGVKGVIHCFSGSEKLLETGLKLGLFFGIGGILTFKNSHLKDVIHKVPLEFVVFETDAPYLAPVPKRGKRNEPLYIKYVIEKMAELLGEDCEKVAVAGFENAKSLFSLDRI